MTTDRSDVFEPQRLAEELSAARDRLPAATLAVPATLQDAMDVQTAWAASAPSAAVGYKVAISPDGIAVSGWLLPLKTTDRESLAIFPWRDGVRIEVEIAVKLGKALPPRDEGYSRDEVIDAVGTVHLGVEILDSRLQEGGNAPYLLYLADRLGNAGYLLGPELPKSILDAVEGCPLEVLLTGERRLFSGKAHHPVGDVVAWLVAYASATTRRPGTLEAGNVVTTGSLCGAVAVASPGIVRAELQGYGGITLSFGDID